MQPLTHRVWAQHYTELRQVVLNRFPLVEPEEVIRVNDDFDALVETLEHATGMDADRVLEELRNLDVRELLERGEQETAQGQPAGEQEEQEQGSVAKLSLGRGFHSAERPRILERMSKLDRQLRRFPAQHTWLELSVKDRDSTTQVVTLAAELPGLGRITSSSKEGQLAAALADVRDDMVDRIRDGIEKRTRGAR
jgi:hypothetical protein